MNGAHLHLLVNHFPIILPITGILVLLIGLISKSEAVRRTGYLIFILGSVSAIAAMTTGEGAEKVAEKVAGVSEDFIGRHEDAAKIFSIMSYVLGGISVLGLWISFKKKSIDKTVAILTIIFAFVVLFFARQTGTTGGEIRHTEIRSDANQNSPVKTIDTEKEDD